MISGAQPRIQRMLLQLDVPPKVEAERWGHATPGVTAPTYIPRRTASEQQAAASVVPTVVGLLGDPERVADLSE